MKEPDYRSERSQSPEGKGIARRAWDAYAATVNKTIGPTLRPIVKPAVEPIARTYMADMIGFWVLWHIYGGFEGLERLGYHRATIYRKIKRFRTFTGMHPDEWTVEGITIDPEAYWAAAAEASEEQDGADDQA